MGLDTQGSDISPDMVDASRVNLDWFTKEAKTGTWDVKLADACNHTWDQPIDSVACETYLGPALRALPDKKVLNRIIEEVDDIHARFLQNLAPQLKPGAQLALAVPAWYENNQFIDLPMLDYLEKLGYNRSSFEHTSTDLVYHRSHQVVGRRIVVMRRK